MNKTNLNSVEKIVVAIIEPVGAHGGMDYYDIGLCEGLVFADITPILYTSEPIHLNMEYPISIKVFYKNIFGNAPAWIRGFYYLLGSLRSLLHAKINGAEICHLHFFHIGLLEFINLILARMLGAKVIITAHDVQSFVNDLSIPVLAKAAYRLAHHIIVHNRASQTELMKVYGLPSKKVSVISSGNYLYAVGSLPSQIEARKQLNLPSDTKVVLFFGQIKKVKGLDILIRAFEIVRKTLPNTYLVIAGRPWKDDLSVYTKMITDLGISQYIRPFFKFIPDNDMPTFFSAADLIVLPYRKIYQSAVLLMAMSYGKAALVSDLDAMKEIIKDGETGYLFPSEDVSALAKKITEILSNQEDLQSVAAQGLEFIRKEYSWKKVGSITSSCYRALLRSI